jgi:hypothetical protein
MTKQEIKRWILENFELEYHPHHIWSTILFKPKTDIGHMLHDEHIHNGNAEYLQIQATLSGMVGNNNKEIRKFLNKFYNAEDIYIRQVMYDIFLDCRKTS